VLVTPTETPTPTTFLFAIPPAPQQPGTTTAVTKPFTHITVFLLPGVVLPAGSAAAIYLITPPSGPSQTQPNYKFLGGIGPGKESAIFKINNPSSSSPMVTSNSTSTSNVAIGISVEAAESVAARIAELSSSSTNSTNSSSASGVSTSTALVPARQPPSTLVLAQRIIKNAFNFLASFSGTAGQVEVVPLKAFEDWWRKFESRVRSDPGFLERDD
jgi:hypothetical protein